MSEQNWGSRPLALSCWKGQEGDKVGPPCGRRSGRTSAWGGHGSPASAAVAAEATALMGAGGRHSGGSAPGFSGT